MSEHAHAEHDDRSYVHVSSPQTLIAVFLALVALTILTVWVAKHEVGRFDLLVAMAIAIVKCSLVMGFFMHLKYDRAMNRLVFFGSLLFFAFFLGITTLDLDSSKPEIEDFRIENPMIKAPAASDSVKPGAAKKEAGTGDHEKK